MGIFRSPHFAWLERTFVVLLAALVGAELLIYSPPVQHTLRSLNVSVDAVRPAADASRLTLTITHSSAVPVLRFVAFPLSDKTIQKASIFVFNDATYPTANATATAGEGVFDHLSGELGSRNYPATVTSVTADELTKVLMSTSDASQRAIVLMTGALPATVFSSTVDLLTPWVQAGGLVVTGGATIGYWSALPRQPLTAANVVGEKGTERLLGKGVVKYPLISLRTGNVPTELGSAFGISYNLTSDGVLRDAVFARGGQTFGWYSGVYSSVSYLPLGLGGYLIFGGEILDEAATALDIARIVLSGAIVGAGPVASRDIRLVDIPGHATVTWDLPFGIGKHGIRVAVFDPNPDGIFFYSLTITA